MDNPKQVCECSLSCKVDDEQDYKERKKTITSFCKFFGYSVKCDIGVENTSDELRIALKDYYNLSCDAKLYFPVRNLEQAINEVALIRAYCIRSNFVFLSCKLLKIVD